MIIGISGKKQSGKDTVGKIIQYLTIVKSNDNYRLKEPALIETVSFEKYNKDSLDKISKFKIKKFADKVKDIVCLMINCTREQLEDEGFKNTELGEEWRVWYVCNYKLQVYSNPLGKVTKFFNTEEEAEYSIKVDAGYLYMDREDLSVQTHTLTPRKLLQLVGTECGRDILHPNIWVNSTMSEYVSVKVKDALLNEKTKKASDKLWKIGHLRESNWIITDV